MANYTFKNPTVEQVPVGSTINSGNFTQLEPDTPIMVGRTLTINSGNFTNVRQDPNWIINGGNWTQVSRCSHVRPNLISRGLEECEEDCEHVVDTDVIQVDGVTIETIYYYKDKGV